MLDRTTRRRIGVLERWVSIGAMLREWRGVIDPDDIPAADI
jgi:hypothetical protein